MITARREVDGLWRHIALMGQVLSELLRTSQRRCPWIRPQGARERRSKADGKLGEHGVHPA